MSGLASWFGKRPSIVEAQPRRPAGQPVEQLRRDQPAHAAAGVEHDVERLDDRRVDERHHVLDVGVERRRCVVTVPRRGRRRRQAVVGDHVADVGDARRRRSAETPPARTIFMPLYCSGLCDAVICTPPSRPSLATAKYSMSVRDHAVVDDVGALRVRAVDERRGHAPATTAACRAPTRDALRLRDRRRSRADRARAVLVDLVGIEAADVVGLEDVGIQIAWT